MATNSTEDTLQIAFERVAKVNSPLLVIGLGGTGCDIVREIKNTFKKRYLLDKAADGTEMDRPARTAYLAIDTDSGEMTGFSKDEFVHLQVDGLGALLAARNSLQPYETAWLDPNFNAIKSGPGAGSIRQASRFMLSRCFGTVCNKISSAINGILTAPKTGETPGRLEVVICAGISGGTGSGTFLDIPQIVRHVQKNSPYQPNITAYLVMPDATFAMSKMDVTIQPSFQANAYAALKELDFWQRYDEHKSVFTAQYDNSASGKIRWVTPYDAVVLLSATDTKGKLIENPADEIQKTVAENLLHYLAAEVENHSDDSGRPQYSYISHENNLVRLLKNQRLEMKTPLYHGYRAVGAFTMAVPKRKMFAYETVLLFKSFMPAYSEIDGSLLANEIRLNHNTLVEDAAKIPPDMKSRLKNFTTKMLPAFCRTAPTDAGAVKSMQDATTKPHDKADQNNWRSSKVYSEANADARKYLEEAWVNFVKYAQSIIENSAEGPYSLERYLTDNGERGFVPQMIAFRNDIEKKYKTSQNNKANAYKACCDTYNDFKKPPMIGKGKAIQTYLDTLKTYYNYVISTEFFENHLAAVNHLLSRITRFRDLALIPMNKDLLAIRDEFNNDELMRASDNDLISMNILIKRIDEVFNSRNDEGQITLTYLKKLGEMVTATESNEDPKASYVSFTYRDTSSVGKYELLRDTLNECFERVFSGSVDTLLEQEANGDKEVMDKSVTQRIDSLKNAASPLFADANILSETEVPFIFLSVPQDSEAFLNYSGTHQNDQNFTPKASSITDRVYCLLTWDGIPVSRYSQFRMMESAYRSRVDINDVSGGLHLVRTHNQVNPSVANDWSKLPEPAPYYFFDGNNGDPESTKRFNAVLDLVKRGIDSGFSKKDGKPIANAGLLVMDDTKEKPVFDIHLFYANKADGILASSDMLKKRIQDVLELSINPATRMPYSAEEKLEALNKILDDEMTITKQGACGISIMRLFCGLTTDEPINPFDEATIQAGGSNYERAKVNYHNLAIAFCGALLDADPYLVERMNAQIEVFEAWRDAYDKIIGAARIWEPRISYSETFAGLLINEIIVTKGGHYAYRDTSKAIRMVYTEDSPYLADDLKNEDSELIAACSFLADSPENEVNRTYLEHRLSEKNKDLQKRQLDDEVEADEYETLIESCSDVLESVQDDINILESKKHDFGANLPLIEKKLDMLNRMKAYTEKQHKSFKKALRQLG